MAGSRIASRGKGIYQECDSYASITGLFVEETRQFLRAIETGHPAGATAEEAYAAVAVAEAIERSLATGTEVDCVYWEWFEKA